MNLNVDTKTGAPPDIDLSDVAVPVFDYEMLAVRNETDVTTLAEVHTYMSIEGEPGCREQLYTLDASQAVKAIRAYVDSYIAARITGAGLAQAEVGKRVIQVLESKNFGNLEHGSPLHYVHGEVLLKRNRLIGALTQEWLGNAENTGLTPVAALEYDYLQPAMAAVDQLYFKRTYIGFPHDEEAQPMTAEKRRQRGMTNECAVIRSRDGQIVEVPLHEAYTAEVTAIVESYDELISQLQRLEGERGEFDEALRELCERKIRYYKAVREAYATSDPALWLKADALLAQQVPDASHTVHIHGIERGYDMVDELYRPEQISLRTPDSATHELQQGVDETKAIMLKNLELPLFADFAAARGTRGLLANSKAAIRTTMGVGWETYFPAAGQCLPNELVPRVEGGIDISLMPFNRKPQLRSLFATMFGEDQTVAVFDKYSFTPEQVVAIDHAGHEFSHALCLNANLTGDDNPTKRLVDDFTEEWKATAGGGMIRVFAEYMKNATPENFKLLAGWVVARITSMIRIPRVRHNPAFSGYVRENIMYPKLLEDTGILSLIDAVDDEFPLKIDISEAKVLDFFARLFSQFIQTDAMYGSGSENDVRAFLTQHLRPTASVDYLFDKTPVPGNPTVESFCALPEQQISIATLRAAIEHAVSRVDA